MEFQESFSFLVFFFCLGGVVFFWYLHDGPLQEDTSLKLNKMEILLHFKIPLQYFALVLHNFLSNGDLVVSLKVAIKLQAANGTYNYFCKRNRGILKEKELHARESPFKLQSAMYMAHFEVCPSSYQPQLVMLSINGQLYSCSARWKCY